MSVRICEFGHRTSRLHILTHSLAAYKLALMRDRNCSTNKFRTLAKELGIFLTYEATSGLEYRLDNISDNGELKTNRKYVVIPVLRSGLPIAEGASEIIPSARIGHFGFRRLEGSTAVERHLIALPTPENAHYIILDTVIGTGNTATIAVDILKDIGTRAEDITFCALLAARPGLEQLFDKHDGVQVYVASLEECLNDRGHVVPGFGSDENDKMFGIR